MKHYTEEDLILHYYGEFDDPALKPHLANCTQCRVAYDSLTGVFAAVDTAPVPERAEGYADEVWERLQEKLDVPDATPVVEPVRRFSWRELFTVPRLSMAASMALVVVIAFIAGRHTVPSAPVPEQVRERILLVAVGDHLERSQRLLVELVNTPGGPNIDFTDQLEAAEDLVRDNRLYRQTAARSGDATVADLLEELERLLLDISHSPADLKGAELIELRRSIEQRGILLKIQVLGGEARRAAQPSTSEI